MTLQRDLEILLGEPGRAKSIHASLWRKNKSRQQAYAAITAVARQAQLGILRLATLLLKYEDERYQRSDAPDRDDAPERTETWAAGEFIETLSRYDERHPVHTRQDLMLLIAQISVFRLKDLPMDSPALAYLDEQRRQTLEQLAGIDEESANRFHKLMHHWLLHNLELINIEASLSRHVQRAFGIRHKFMQLFGKEFLAERAQFCRMDVADRRLELLRVNPGINEADLERMLGKGKGRGDSGLSRQQLETPPGCILSPPANSSTSADGNYNRAKSLWRNLAALTHPDKLRQHRLNWHQRCQLESIWHEVSALRTGDSKQVFARSVIFLERKLQLAERILALAHIEDLDASLVVQGSTIDEQIRWLEAANDCLDENIRSTRADRLRYVQNHELEDMQALLESPEVTQQTARQAMRERSEAYNQRAHALEQELSRISRAQA